MPSTVTYLAGTLATLLDTQLNALANNGLAVGGAYTAAGGYLMAQMELLVTFAAAPAANTGISVWFLRNIDGTNYEDGADGVTTPARAPDVVFPLRAVTTAQRISRRVTLPHGTWLPLLKDDGTGAALAATGNTLRIYPFTYQGS